MSSTNTNNHTTDSISPSSIDEWVEKTTAISQAIQKLLHDDDDDEIVKKKNKEKLISWKQWWDQAQANRNEMMKKEKEREQNSKKLESVKVKQRYSVNYWNEKEKENNYDEEQSNKSERELSEQLRSIKSKASNNNEELFELEGLLMKYPYDIALLNNIALCYIQLKLWEDAFEFLKRVCWLLLVQSNGEETNQLLLLKATFLKAKVRKELKHDDSLIMTDLDQCMDILMKRNNREDTDDQDIYNFWFRFTQQVKEKSNKVLLNNKSLHTLMDKFMKLFQKNDDLPAIIELVSEIISMLKNNSNERIYFRTQGYIKQICELFVSSSSSQTENNNNDNSKLRMISLLDILSAAIKDEFLSKEVVLKYKGTQKAIQLLIAPQPLTPLKLSVTKFLSQMIDFTNSSLSLNNTRRKNMSQLESVSSLQDNFMYNFLHKKADIIGNYNLLFSISHLLWEVLQEIDWDNHKKASTSTSTSASSTYLSSDDVETILSVLSQLTSYHQALVQKNSTTTTTTNYMVPYLSTSLSLINKHSKYQKTQTIMESIQNSLLHIMVNLSQIPSIAACQFVITTTTTKMKKEKETPIQVLLEIVYNDDNNSTTCYTRKISALIALTNILTLSSNPSVIVNEILLEQEAQELTSSSSIDTNTCNVSGLTKLLSLCFLSSTSQDSNFVDELRSRALGLLSRCIVSLKTKQKNTSAESNVCSSKINALIWKKISEFECKLQKLFVQCVQHEESGWKSSTTPPLQQQQQQTQQSHQKHKHYHNVASTSIFTIQILASFSPSVTTTRISINNNKEQWLNTLIDVLPEPQRDVNGKITAQSVCLPPKEFQQQKQKNKSNNDSLCCARDIAISNPTFYTNVTKVLIGLIDQELEVIMETRKKSNDDDTNNTTIILLSNDALCISIVEKCICILANYSAVKNINNSSRSSSSNSSFSSSSTCNSNYFIHPVALKNTAACLAKLIQNKKNKSNSNHTALCMKRFRELRGMLILMELGRMGKI